MGRGRLLRVMIIEATRRTQTLVNHFRGISVESFKGFGRSNHDSCALFHNERGLKVIPSRLMSSSDQAMIGWLSFVPNSVNAQERPSLRISYHTHTTKDKKEVG